MSVSRRDTTSSLIADLRRRVGWLEKRTAPAGAKKLDDLSDVTIRTPGAAQVLTYDGAQWVNAAAVAGDLGVLETVAEYTDDGIFDELSPFDWSPSITVNANSRQLVIVTAYAEPSDSLYEATEGVVGGGGGTVTISFEHPTPWKLTAYDDTFDPTAADVVGQGSVGSSWAQVALWLTNDTDADQSNTLYVSVGALNSAYEFDATVTVTARSVFSLVAP